MLAARGVASRRAAEELIAAGRVAVNGRVVKVLGTKVDPGARITVDGAPVGRAEPHRYLLLNKPFGVVSTARDERGRPTVVSLVGARQRMYPVGRLDADSEGLLVLTNDGAWAQRALHPSFGHEREYEATVEGVLTPEVVARLERGVRLEEGVARAASLSIRGRTRGGGVLRIVLRTGWRRQVRRMCAAVGLRVTRLVRVRFGALALGRLAAGSWRDLTASEITALGGK